MQCRKGVRVLTVTAADGVCRHIQPLLISCGNELRRLTARCMKTCLGFEFTAFQFPALCFFFPAFPEFNFLQFLTSQRTPRSRLEYFLTTETKTTTKKEQLWHSSTIIQQVSSPAKRKKSKERPNAPKQGTASASVTIPGGVQGKGGRHTE